MINKYVSPTTLNNERTTNEENRTVHSTTRTSSGLGSSAWRKRSRLDETKMSTDGLTACAPRTMHHAPHHRSTLHTQQPQPQENKGVLVFTNFRLRRS